MLRLVHDYTSAASALAVRRAQRVADDGLPVAFESFEAIGLDMVVPVLRTALDEIASLADVAAREGCPLRRPDALPPTGPAHVVEAVAESCGRGGVWRDAAYRAFWAEGADIAATDTLLALARRAGLPVADVSAALADPSALVEVRRRTARLRREGIGGVPTIVAQRTLVPGLLPEEDLRRLAAL